MITMAIIYPSSPVWGNKGAPSADRYLTNSITSSTIEASKL